MSKKLPVEISKRNIEMISLDTETNGLDFFHGAAPYIVTTCDEQEEVTFFEWDVDPYTRKVEVPPEDVEAIKELVSSNDIVGQNFKFDLGALSVVIPDIEWPWERTQDTIIAGHLLASNQPHNLTTMAMVYLGINIQPFEDVVKLATNEARRMAKKLGRKRTVDLFTGTTTGGEWRIAKKDLPEMPSAKESTWKFDMWLPRAIAMDRGFAQLDVDCEHEYDEEWTCKKCSGHHWWTVTSEYANADSAVTIKLFREMERRLKEKGLWELYLEKMKTLPALFDMERRGTTVSVPELKALHGEYARDTSKLAETCIAVAKRLNFDLELPKGSANNNSLTTFAFDVLKLPVIKKTDSGNPSLDKDVIVEYSKTLVGDQLEFVEALGGRKKRNKSLEYMNSYLKFGINVDNKFLVLHPSINSTGTDTTRFSMSNPNLQQVSKQEKECPACGGEGCVKCGMTGEDLHSVRRIFCPAPERELWSMDARNIELRIPAYESGEEALIALFERPNDAPFYGSQHLLNFSIVYPDIWAKELKIVGIEKVGPHCKKRYASTWYQWVKNGDFAIQYQCGQKTADAAFHRDGAFYLLKSRFDKLEALNTWCVDFANKHGYVETIPDIGTKRGYPLRCPRSDRGGVLSTTPLNYRTQGTAGRWMVKAINRCWPQLQEWNRESDFDGYMSLTVHDELLFDFPKGRGKEPWKTNLPRVSKLQRLMQQGGKDIGIPTPVSREYHADNWSEGKSV